MARKLLGTAASVLALSLSGPLCAGELQGDAVGQLSLTEFRGDLTDPTAFDWLPDGRMIVSLREGVVVLVAADGQSETMAGAFNNVDTGGERGLLGVAVHPNFSATREVFFFLSRTGNPSNRNVVMKATLAANGVLDTAGADIILDDLYDSDSAQFHNGGGLAISGDNQYLYVSTGDATNTSNSQCLTNGSGKIHRVDFNGAAPASNPLAALASASCGAATGAPRDSLFAWGFRNPYRIWTDKVTGNLWVGDVGQNTEEIDLVTPTGNENYGYPNCDTPTTPSTGNCVDPIHSYPTSGSAIMGGVIADGCQWPEGFRDRYYFGDYVDSELYSIAVNPARDGMTGQRSTIGTTQGGPVHFGLGPDGAVYYSTLSGDDIWRIAPANPLDCDPGGGGSGGGGGAGGAPGAGGGVAGGSGGSAGSGAGSDNGGASGNVAGSAGSAGASVGPSAGGTATAGATTSQSGGAATAGASATAGSTSNPATSGSVDDGGCGCSVVGSPSRGWAWLLLSAAAAATALRRRVGLKRRP